MTTPYKLGRQSKQRLVGVHPRLVETVTLALHEHATVDFAVVEGVRSEARQAALRASGASQVAKSRHQVQADGYGHAVDLAPWVDGRLQWELTPQCMVARAIALAAGELGVAVRWGGTWARLTVDTPPMKQVNAYIDKRRAQGRTPFVDAWHFELLRR